MAYSPLFRVYAHTQPTVGAASTLVLAANDERRYALIQNLGNEPVYLNVGAAAVLNQGIQLPGVDGDGNVCGAYEMHEGAGNLSRLIINGISVGGGDVQLVTEATGP